MAGLFLLLLMINTMSRGEPLDEDLWGPNPVDLERQLIKEKTNGKTT